MPGFSTAMWKISFEGYSRGIALQKYPRLNPQTNLLNNSECPNIVDTSFSMTR